MLAGFNKQLVDVPVLCGLVIGAFSLLALGAFGGGWPKDAAPSAAAVALAAPGRRGGLALMAAVHYLAHQATVPSKDGRNAWKWSLH